MLDPGRQFLDSNGAVAAGGLLTVYDTDTTIVRTTYIDNAGAVAHESPIELNSAGQIPNDVMVWATTGDVKLVVTDSAGANAKTYNDITLVNDVTVSAASEWVASGLTPTYSSATVFTLAGDQTAIFHVNRRLKLTDATVLYGTILTSAFTTVTTVTVTMDSGSLSASLTAVSYGLLSATNTSSPTRPASIQTFTISGTYTPTPGIRSAKIEVWGAGGAGGGAAITGVGEHSSCGGGAAGGYAMKMVDRANLGVSQTITIGAAGEAATGANGGTGGPSSCTLTGLSTIAATGGSGGLTIGATAILNSGNHGNGGVGSNGDVNAQGSAGLWGLGWGTTDANAVKSGGGTGGSSTVGAGGRSSLSTTSAAGANGTGKASGGSGARQVASEAATSLGGEGTAGLIVITEYV